MTTTASTATGRQRLLRRVLIAVAGVVLLLTLLVVFFPWDTLREPLNRYVSERTGRHFEITRKLDVRLGRTTRVFADGIVFANPSWSQERNLVEAQRAEIHVRLWRLLFDRRVELPMVALQKPKLGLEMLPDGRRSWALQSDGQGEGELEIGALKVDQGSLRFLAKQHGADIKADFQIDAAPAGQAPDAASLPLGFRAAGRWRDQPFQAQGRTGNVLGLREALQEPFPAEVAVTAGATTLQANGSVRSISSFGGADLQFRLRGPSLADLYQLAEIVLPATPPYDVQGRLVRQGAQWQATALQGRLGRSDITGALTLDQSKPKPHLAGQLTSRSLDFEDLAPLVGMEPPRTAKGKVQQQRRKAGARVLPATPVDLRRLQVMNADVRVSAERVVNAPHVPLERFTTQVRLQDGVLRLDPLDLAVAGGRLVGRVTMDGRALPSQGAVELQASGLQLAKLFPTVDLNRASVGQVHGRIVLDGKGRTVGQMLGAANGDIALLVSKGRISNLLLEISGLDGGEVIRFLMGKDQYVDLRCGAASFDVKNGLMSSRALVLDTTDTVIYGQGTINLANEALDLTFKPLPKDMSILAMRSPLKLQGTLGAPQPGVDSPSLIARAGMVLALTVINPLLGLAATIETGPGQDADCTAVLKAATTPNAASPSAQAPAPAGAGSQPAKK